MPHGGTRINWDDRHPEISLVRLPVNPRHHEGFVVPERRHDRHCHDEPESRRSRRIYSDGHYLSGSDNVPHRYLRYLNADQAEFVSHDTPGSRVFQVRREPGHHRAYGLARISARQAEDIERAHRGGHATHDYLGRGREYGRWGGSRYRGRESDIPGTSVYVLGDGRGSLRDNGFREISRREARDYENAHSFIPTRREIDVERAAPLTARAMGWSRGL